MQIVLGHGRYLIAPIELEGRIGVFFQMMEEALPVGPIVKDWAAKDGVVTVGDDDLIIWLDSADAATMLSRQANLALSGFATEPANPGDLPEETP